MFATGYVHNLVDRKLTFEEWIWTCARAMGAFSSMREDGMNAPIPDRIDSGSYREDRLKQSRKKLDDLTKMSLADIGETRWKEAVELYESSAKHHEEQKQKREHARMILRRTEDWVPPTPEHENFKKFMLDQLKQSLDYEPDEPKKPVRKSDPEYMADALKELMDDIEYQQKRLMEEQQANETQNEWIRRLRNSVPVPTSMQKEKTT